MNLESIKKFPVFKIFYRFPGLIGFYHFSLSFISGLFYGFPSRKVFVIGVTGTKGKTTALEVIDDILSRNGDRTALLSSLYIKVGEHKEKNLTDNTMPGRFFLQRFLKQAEKAGCKYALIEVTSQGVSLHRHKFINWRMAAVLNLSPEHIEAHGSFEKYREAKLNFLEYAAQKGATVFINEDSPSADFFLEKLRNSKVVLFSGSERSLGITNNIDSKSYLLSSIFNRENFSLAVAITRSLGVKENFIVETARSFKGVPGRMEFVQRDPFSAVVDYAHTPDSLAQVYKTLKGNYLNRNSKLICVLGSAGGGRDKWKRPEMGKMADQYCDQIILTNEDPYDEDPSLILTEIKDGILKKEPITILDRQAAIKKAVDLAKKGDVVVVTGKGSEPYIHVKNGAKIVWSDTRAVLRALKKEAPMTL